LKPPGFFAVRGEGGRSEGGREEGGRESMELSLVIAINLFNKI